MLCSTASGNASRAKVLLALSVLTLLGSPALAWLRESYAVC